MATFLRLRVLFPGTECEWHFTISNITWSVRPECQETYVAVGLFPYLIHSLILREMLSNLPR
ncbi:MAG: hypothetical protein ACREDR_46860 [Blastocatellia bacterium]